MAILNFDQVIKKLRMDQCTVVDIWEGHINNVKEENIFSRIHSESTEALTDELTLFASDFPGNYTIIARPANNHAKSTGFMYRCKFDLAVQQNPPAQNPIYNKNGQPINGTAQNLDYNKIFEAAHAKAMLDMKTMLELHTIKAERDFYKLDSERMKVPAHKIGYLLEFGIERLFSKATGLNTTSMNGSNQPAGFSNLANLMNGNQQQQQQQLTPEQQQELENNLGIIVQQIGIDNINKLANSMKNNPSIGQMIKLQIESSK